MIKGDERGYRKVVAKAMRTLGTVPEDHLIRHPFYRARWREDMVRQVDLYAAQKRKADPNWDGYFTDKHGVHSIDLAIKKRSFKPHITLPKRVKRPFNIFQIQHFKARRAEFPEDTKSGQILSVLAKEWNELP